MIVPFAPGGLNDTTARLLQPQLEKALGQTVIVDNRPAASGIVGTDAVAKAAPDGHSLLVVASSHAVVPATNPKVPYNIERDLAAITLVSQKSVLLCREFEGAGEDAAGVRRAREEGAGQVQLFEPRRRRSQSPRHRVVQRPRRHHAAACAVPRRRARRSSR